MNKSLAILAGAGMLAFASSTQANVLNVLGSGDFAADSISSVTGNPGLGDQNVLNWAGDEATVHGLTALGSGFSSSDYTGGPIAAGDYLVLHYGKGPGGASPGGGLVALFFNSDVAAYDVPQTGSGPNGNGGLSFARLIGPAGPNTPRPNTVPDGANAMALLGMSMSGLAWFARFRKAKA